MTNKMKNLIINLLMVLLLVVEGIVAAEMTHYTVVGISTMIESMVFCCVYVFIIAGIVLLLSLLSLAFKNKGIYAVLQSCAYLATVVAIGMIAYGMKMLPESTSNVGLAFVIVIGSLTMSSSVFATKAMKEA